MICLNLAIRQYLENRAMQAESLKFYENVKMFDIFIINTHSFHLFSHAGMLQTKLFT